MGQSESLGRNLVSIQRRGVSPPPNGRHSPHDGLLPSMPSRPTSQGGRPASATTNSIGPMSKRPVSAEIRYYHGRRRHPARSFDATPWHHMTRPAWDASPPCARARSPPYPPTPASANTAFNHSNPNHRPVAALRSRLTPRCLLSRVPSTTPRAIPSAVVAAPQAARNRHRATTQRAGATLSSTLRY